MKACCLRELKPLPQHILHLPHLVGWCLGRGWGLLLDQALLCCWLLLAAPGGRALWLPWWNILHTCVYISRYTTSPGHLMLCVIYVRIYTCVCLFTKVCRWVGGRGSASPTHTWTTGCDCAFCSEVSFSFSFTSCTDAETETAVAVIAYHTYVCTYVPLNTLKHTVRTSTHTHSQALHSLLTHLVLVFWLFIRPRPLPLSLSAFLAVLSPAREPPVFILLGLPAASSGEASWHRGRERRKHACVYIHMHMHDIRTNVRMSPLHINADRIVRSKLLIC